MTKSSETALAPDQLLYTRVQVASLLGSSVATVVRLEALGKLTPIRLTGTSTAMVYFRRAEVLRLAQGGE